MACYPYNLGERARWTQGDNYMSVEGFFDNASTLTPSTTPATEPENQYIGFICCFTAVIFFGINWIPAKKFNTGDGIFFQFIICNAAFAAGVVVHAARGFPPIHPLAMVSGFLWCTGNMLCVPIIQLVGMGLGLLLWNSSNLIIGWASGKWGWFDINPQTPTNIPMNYGGVVMALLSALLFVAVKPNVSHSSRVEPGQNNDFTTLPPRTLNDSDHEAISYQPINSTENEAVRFGNLSSFSRRILGVSFALFSGCLFGLTFTPILVIQDHPNIYPGASKNALDYVFTFSLGIYCTSLVYVLIYAMVQRNKPWVSGNLILPAFACGLMWVVGQISFLVAIQYLSEPVSFPIITSGPGIIAALVGVIFFKEITGKRNYLVLLLAFLCAITGALLSGFSKT